MSIKSDIKKYWPLLMANGVYYLCTGLSEAVIGKEVYAILSPRLISLQSIIGWGGGIVLGLAWSKWNKKMFPLLIPMFLMQIIASVLYFIYAEATLNMFIFWVLGLECIFSLEAWQIRFLTGRFLGFSKNLASGPLMII